VNAPLIDQHIDARLAFLARAAARFELVDAGLMEIVEAYDGLVAGLPCACARDTVERWERMDAHRAKGRRP
jgi:hypothetical protein